MNHQKWCICPNFQFAHWFYYKGQDAGNSTDGLFYTFDTAVFMGDDKACQLKALVMTAGFERVAHFFFLFTIH